MSPETRQSMIVSVLIHIAFVMAGVAVFLLETFFEEPEPVVFELVAASAPAQPPPPEQPMEEAPPEDVPPLRPEPLDPLEAMPEMPEEPPSPPEPEPAPRKIMNFEDWARNRDLPEQVQRVERQERREVETPEIRTNLRERLEQELPAIRVEGMDLSVSANNDALQRYLAQLRQRIEAAFVPTGADLQAEAVFTVTANGRIRDIRLKQPSGNAAFDDSVRRALRTARSSGPPPESRAYTFSLVFRSE